MSTYTYAPSYYPHSNTPYVADDNDDAYSSDAGSLGPRDLVAPSTKKPQQLVTPVPQSTAAVNSLSKRPQAKTLRAADAVELLSTAMTYLPLESIEAAREAGPVFEAAASRVVPKPLDNEDVAFVRWEPQVLRTVLEPAKMRKGAPATPAVFPWRCLACGTVTAGPRQCQSCRTPLATSACRVFLGQLRKDLSAEVATQMIRSLCPSVTLFHVESHTNATDGRGKGCAWAYVSTVEDAMRVVDLHKRVFVDIDADGGEGFWFVKDAGLSPQLVAMADAIGAGRNRPQYFPRQALVAELPGKCMLADYVKSGVYQPVA